MIVALLQNPWFKPETPAYIIDNYRTNPDYRRKVLSLSKTGKMLERAFGDKFCEIYWDNANPNHANHSAGAMPPDVEHIKKIIIEQKPRIVLCFAATARGAVAYLKEHQASLPGLFSLAPIEYEYCPHPASRQITQFQLNEFAQKVIDLYMQ
jgi:hypothetical protein